MYKNREEELESVIAQWTEHLWQTVEIHLDHENDICANRAAVVELLKQERAFNAGIVNLCLTGE